MYFYHNGEKQFYMMKHTYTYILRKEGYTNKDILKMQNGKEYSFYSRSNQYTSEQELERDYQAYKTYLEAIEYEDIKALNLSVRAYMALRRIGLLSIRDITTELEKDIDCLLHIRNVGVKTNTEILNAVRLYNGTL